MTKKDYELIAHTLRDMKGTIIDDNIWDGATSDYEAVCQGFARQLQLTNPKFNADRFLAACGVETM